MTGRRERGLVPLLLGALLLSGCGPSMGAEDATVGRQSTMPSNTADSQPAGDGSPLSSERRLLIEGHFASWPTVSVDTCADYKPTHDREVVVVANNGAGYGECIKAALAADPTVVVVSAAGIQNMPKGDFEPWGRKAGRELLVAVRGGGFCVASSFKLLTAWVPETGEVALLPTRDPMNLPDDWPYRAASDC